MLYEFCRDSNVGTTVKNICEIYGDKLCPLEAAEGGLLNLE